MIKENEAKYLKTALMADLHLIAEDFAIQLQKINNEEKNYDLKDSNVEIGLNLGIRSIVLLLNEYLLDHDGKLHLEVVKKIAENIRDKSQGKTY